MTIQDQNNEGLKGERKEEINVQQNVEESTEAPNNPSLPKEWRFIQSHPK